MDDSATQLELGKFPEFEDMDASDARGLDRVRIEAGCITTQEEAWLRNIGCTWKPAKPRKKRRGAGSARTTQDGIREADSKETADILKRKRQYDKMDEIIRRMCPPWIGEGYGRLPWEDEKEGGYRFGW
ncbi:MAG: hypothetical protein JW902_16930 [Syntrophaceae bacterium]|nr:hypothetical protein [Syntrophaceae bacterium]